VQWRGWGRREGAPRTESVPSPKRKREKGVTHESPSHTASPPLCGEEEEGEEEWEWSVVLLMFHSTTHLYRSFERTDLHDFMNAPMVSSLSLA
jgi:hypothetical protein